MPIKRAAGSKEKLKGRKELTRIFSSGKVVYSIDKKIKAVYKAERTSGKGGIKYAVAISKKAGKAVWRNRVKRLIKEAHRLSTGELFNYCLEKKFLLEIIFLNGKLNEAYSGNITFKDIEPKIAELHIAINTNLTDRKINNRVDINNEK